MKGFLMWCLIGLAAALALWQIQRVEPLVPRLAAAVFMFVLGGMCGLRIGGDSRRRLVEDLIRLNRLLVQQNTELTDLNLQYLRKLVPDGSEAVEPRGREG